VFADAGRHAARILAGSRARRAAKEEIEP